MNNHFDMNILLKYKKIFLIFTTLISTSIIFFIYSSQYSQIKLRFVPVVDEAIFQTFESIEENIFYNTFTKTLHKNFMDRILYSDKKFKDYNLRDNLIVIKIKTSDLDKFYLSLKNDIETFIEYEYLEVLNKTSDELIELKDSEILRKISYIQQKMIIAKEKAEIEKKYNLQFLNDQLARSKMYNFEHISDDIVSILDLKKIYQNDLIFLMGPKFIQAIIDLNSSSNNNITDLEIELAKLQYELKCNSYCQNKFLHDNFFIKINYNIKLDTFLRGIYLYLAYLVAILFSMISSFFCLIMINKFVQLKNKLNAK